MKSGLSWGYNREVNHKQPRQVFELGLPISFDDNRNAKRTPCNTQ